MKTLLKIVAAAICLFMLAVTIRTSMAESLWAAWPVYAANPWAMATFWDAYCGFTLFWLWIVFRERNWPTRILWLLLVLALGNIATGAYLFIALCQLRPVQPASDVLARRPA